MARPVVSEAASRLYDSPNLAAYRKGEGDESGWVLLHMCEAAVRTVAKANEALRYDDRGSGWRRMLDPDRCPSWALDWLRQFAGLDRFPPDFTEQQKRDQIKDSPRFRRGSREAIKNAPLPFLTGQKRPLILLERHGSSRTYRTAMFAADVTDQQRVLDALAAQKPGSFIWEHDWLGEGSWDDVESTHADWNEVEADFTDWQHVLTDPTHT